MLSADRRSALKAEDKCDGKSTLRRGRGDGCPAPLMSSRMSLSEPGHEAHEPTHEPDEPDNEPGT